MDNGVFIEEKDEHHQSHRGGGGLVLPTSGCFWGFWMTCEGIDRGEALNKLGQHDVGFCILQFKSTNNKLVWPR